VEEEFDIIIKNADIVDGSGSPRRKGDVGIRGGKFVKLDRVEGKAKRTIDGSGKVLCPGFVDPHNHADLFIFEEPLTPLLAQQGITTYACGNCGMSLVPSDNNPYVEHLTRTFGITSFKERESFAEWRSRVAGAGIALNMIPFAGHNTLRCEILGSSFIRPSSKKEVQDLGLLVEQVMEEGAWGVSLGLDGGKPGFFADFEELVEVGRRVSRYDGLLLPHTRHHQYNWAASRNPEDTGYGIYYGPKSEAFFGRYHGHLEAIEIAEKSGVRLHIAHMSIPFLVHQPHPSWLDEELARATLEHIIDNAIARGVEVTFDVIPNIESIATERLIIDSFKIDDLTAEEFLKNLGERPFRQKVVDFINSGRLKFAWIHPLVDPYWMDCFIIISSKEKAFRGRILGDLVRERNTGRTVDAVYKLSYEMLFEILEKDPEATWAPILDKRQTGMSTMLKHSRSMPCTDLVIPTLQENPRSIYGISPYTANIFPDYIRRFVREENSLTLEEGIKKATQLPAQEVFGLKDRGLVKEGYWADAVVFDFTTIKGGADFQKPTSPPEGISFVIVNGEIVVEKGKPTGKAPGKVLSRN